MHAGESKGNLRDVTVVMPTYNRGKLIERALESIYQQTARPRKVIVVDDASQDDTADVARKWAQTRGFPLQVEALTKNGGPAVARNRGMELATTQYISFLDSDDEYSPSCLARLMEPFSLFPDTVVSFADATIVTPHESVAHGMLAANIDLEKESQAIMRKGRPYHRLLSPLDSLLVSSIIPTCAACFRRDSALKAGGMPSSFRFGEDWLFWLRLTMFGEFYFQLEDLAVIHRHDENLTHPRSSAFLASEKVKGFSALLDGSVGLALDESRLARVRDNYARQQDAWYYHLSRLGIRSYVDGISRARGSGMVDGNVLVQLIKRPKALMRSLGASLRVV